MGLVNRGQQRTIQCEIDSESGHDVHSSTGSLSEGVRVVVVISDDHGVEGLESITNRGLPESSVMFFGIRDASLDLFPADLRRSRNLVNCIDDSSDISWFDDPSARSVAQ